jgi:hypothetical protein
MPPHEVEARKLLHQGLIESRLEIPVEGFEGLALAQAARIDAASDATFELLADLGAEDVLKQGRMAWALTGSPGEGIV